MSDQIRQVGVEHVILTSDFGQIANPEPVEGFAHYLEKLRSIGFTTDQLRAMIHDNPKRLMQDKKEEK